MDCESAIEAKPCPKLVHGLIGTLGQGPEFTWEVNDQIQEEISTPLHQECTIVKCRVISLEDKAHLTGEDYNTSCFRRSLSTRCEGYIGGYIMKSCIKDLVALHFVYLLWAGNLLSFLVEDDSDIGSPVVDGPPIMPEDLYAYIMAAYEVPMSPDYIPGLEVPPSPDNIPGPKEPQLPPPLDFVPEPMYPEYMPQEDEILPAKEQPLPAAAASPTADSPGYGYDEDEYEDGTGMKRRRREEVERLLALTTPPPSPLTPLSSPLPQIPSPPPNSPTYIEILESCLPLRKRVCFASPSPSHEVAKSSAAGAARQDRPTIARDDPYSIAREDLYGFVDVVDVPPRCSTSRELDYDITDIWDDLVGAIDEIAPTTAEGVNQRVTDLATIVEEETTSMYGIMEDAQDDQS
ncbi:hypothetical protein Tco_1427566 [Tanacetum coccineum]